MSISRNIGSPSINAPATVADLWRVGLVCVLISVSLNLLFHLVLFLPLIKR